jgi:hypothetical protein
MSFYLEEKIYSKKTRGSQKVVFLAFSWTTFDCGPKKEVGDQCGYVADQAEI